MIALLVDDEPEMIELLTHYLSPFCSRIESADTLELALKKADEIAFNLCVLDLRLIDSGAENTINHIPDFKKHKMSVVVISGAPQPNIKRMSLASGADVFVAKDGSFGDLAMKIAVEIAVLKMPKDAFRSESFSGHVKMLHNLVHPEAA